MSEHVQIPIMHRGYRLGCLELPPEWVERLTDATVILTPALDDEAAVSAFDAEFMD